MSVRSAGWSPCATPAVDGALRRVHVYGATSTVGANGSGAVPGYKSSSRMRCSSFLPRKEVASIGPGVPVPSDSASRGKLLEPHCDRWRGTHGGLAGPMGSLRLLRTRRGRRLAWPDQHQARGLPPGLRALGSGRRTGRASREQAQALITGKLLLIKKKSP